MVQLTFIYWQVNVLHNKSFLERVWENLFFKKGFPKKANFSQHQKNRLKLVKKSDRIGRNNFRRITAEKNLNEKE